MRFAVVFYCVLLFLVGWNYCRWDTFAAKVASARVSYRTDDPAIELRDSSTI